MRYAATKHCLVCSKPLWFETSGIMCRDCEPYFAEPTENIAWTMDRLMGEGHTEFCAKAQCTGDAVCICGLDATGEYTTEENWG